MKRISSYFNTPQSSRKRPSAAHNPQPESHSSTEGKTPHEEKKKCSRIFQPSWKQTYPWLKFTEGKMYCGACLDSINSAELNRAVAHWLASGERRRRPEYMDQNRRDAE